MICPECGTRLSDGETKCHLCGHTGTHELPAPKPYQGKISRDVLNISIGVLFGLLVGFLVPDISDILFDNPIIGIAVLVVFFGNLLYIVYRIYRNKA
jgi:hypothetical protein